MRNAGLEIATGDFVQFLDADDYLDYTKFGVVNQCGDTK
jgi:glycosyltransferase involved in cell wall biosynthesis